MWNNGLLGYIWVFWAIVLPTFEGLGECLCFFLKVLVKKEPCWEYFSLKGDPNRMGNPTNGHFGDRYFEHVPHVFRAACFSGLTVGSSDGCGV